MKRSSLISGIIIAALLSLAAPIVFHAAQLLVPRGLAMQVSLATVTGAYLLHLLWLTGVRTGSVVLGATSLMVLLLALVADLSTGGFAIVAIAMLWVARSLLAYSSPMMALADGGICLLG